MPPRVSLILCVKNGLPYLPEAIESVRRQDDVAGIELVVQDGSSDDGSLAYLQSIEDLDVVLDSRPDSGVGQAYNRALARCSADIVGSIDADNRLEDDAIATVLDFFAREPVAALYGDSRFIDEGGADLGSIPSRTFNLVDLLLSELVPPFASSFFSRSRSGATLHFEESMSTCVDFDLWLRLSPLDIGYAGVSLSSTRQSAKSMSRGVSNYDQFCADKISALDRYWAGVENSRLVVDLSRKARAGVFLWAAESVLGLEGPATSFEGFLKKAEALDPGSARSAYLRERSEIVLETQRREGTGRLWRMISGARNGFRR